MSWAWHVSDVGLLMWICGLQGTQRSTPSFKAKCGAWRKLNMWGKYFYVGQVHCEVPFMQKIWPLWIETDMYHGTLIWYCTELDNGWSSCDRQALDYETTSSYTFTVQVRENLRNLRFPADNVGSAVTAAQVNIAQDFGLWTQVRSLLKRCTE